jgi:peptidoglycan/xylan/chitin deacetylase (PgdA/CDA1 family)
MKTQAFKAGLGLMHATGLHRLLAPYCAGSGIIFTLHHVRPKIDPAPDFHPNGILEITPEFLDATIKLVRASGFELLSLDQAVARLHKPVGQKFAVFTLDDGYADNIKHALPVFERHGCPFTVFVTTRIIEGDCELWWLVLERLIAQNNEFAVRDGQDHLIFKTETPAQKQTAYAALYWRVRGMEQHEQRDFIRKLATEHGLDIDALCRTLAMTWDDVRSLQAHRLASVGAHTVNHYALAQLSETEATSEISESRAWIEEETGAAPDFLCYPYGDPGSAGEREFALAQNLGFKAAVTTRKGTLHADHARRLTALPRVSLNGEFQTMKYVELFLTGAPFALWNSMRRLKVA